tara:strand:+ start:6562 stop:7290 length:729 start_codon:yes stop_codon:yes gene_type:complete
MTKNKKHDLENNLIIKIKNIDLKLKNNFFFKDLSLNIQNNGITFLLGPNGSGKSLCLKLIAGLVKPDRGKIEFYSKKTIKIGYVSQKTVFLRRNVFDNLKFTLRIMNYPKNKISATIKKILSIANFEKYSNVSARNLSIGQQQLLSVLRALIIKPNILLLDEPCSNLDPQTTKKIEDILLSIKKTEIKIIIVTHDLLQVKRLADDVFFINNGVILENSRKNIFFNNPKSKSVMNYINGNLLN